MPKVPVLINRGAGTLKSERGIAAKVRQAFEQAGVEAEVELVKGGKCEVRCRALVERNHPLIVVGGGDGSLRAAASVLAGSKTRLGILPLGTRNHLARDLRLPLDMDKAVKVIAAGKERRVDVGEMNGAIFVNNSAIGLYPLLVIDRELQRKKTDRSKRAAMIVAALRTLARFHRERLTLTVNDERARIDTPLLFVGNNVYSTDLAAPGRRERLDAGELGVLVMRKRTRLGFLAASLRALLNRSRSDDMIRIEGVERLRVSSRKHLLAVSLDGEVASEAPPLDYRIRKGALRVIAP